MTALGDVRGVGHDVHVGVAEEFEVERVAAIGAAAVLARRRRRERVGTRVGAAHSGCARRRPRRGADAISAQKPSCVSYVHSLSDGVKPASVPTSAAYAAAQHAEPAALER